MSDQQLFREVETLCDALVGLLEAADRVEEIGEASHIVYRYVPPTRSEAVKACHDLPRLAADYQGKVSDMVCEVLDLLTEDELTELDWYSCWPIGGPGSVIGVTDCEACGHVPCPVCGMWAGKPGDECAHCGAKFPDPDEDTDE